MSGIGAVFVQRCSAAGVVVTFVNQDRVQALIDSGIDMLIVLGTPDPDLYSELHLPFGLPVIGLEMLSGDQPGWGGHDSARSRRRSSSTFRSRVPSTSVGSWGQQRGTFEQWTPDLKQAGSCDRNGMVNGYARWHCEVAGEVLEKPAGKGS